MVLTTDGPRDNLLRPSCFNLADHYIEHLPSYEQQEKEVAVDLVWLAAAHTEGAGGQRAPCLPLLLVLGARKLLDEITAKLK